MTTESHTNFPSTLCKECLKISYESPPGVKKNLQRTMQMWSKPMFEKDAARANILFRLAFFHAIIQERRNYIPQGWVKFYEFS